LACTKAKCWCGDDYGKVLSQTILNGKDIRQVFSCLGVTKLRLQLNMAPSDWSMFKTNLKLYHIQIFDASTVFIERFLDAYDLCILETADSEKRNTPETDDIFLNETTCGLVEGTRAFESTC